MVTKTRRHPKKEFSNPDFLKTAHPILMSDTSKFSEYSGELIEMYKLEIQEVPLQICIFAVVL